MPLVANTRSTEHLKKFLPLQALEVFCKAYNEEEDLGIDHNGCIKAGWGAVSEAGWRKPVAGKKYVKDDPSPGSVHVDGVIGSKSPKKPPPKEIGDDEDDAVKSEDFDFEKKWSDEARAAAAEARRHGIKPDQKRIVRTKYRSGYGHGRQVVHTSMQFKNEKEFMHWHDNEKTHGVTITGHDHYPTGKSEDFETSGEIVKVDEGLGLVFGFAIVCKKDGVDYFDVQGDHIPEDSMVSAGMDFMLNSRMAKDMHAGDAIGDGIVFAFPMTTDIAKALAFDTGGNTGFLVAMKPSAEVLAKFKSGDYTGFSIGGRRIEDEEVPDGVSKTWSDAAREAAIEARRHNQLSGEHETLAGHHAELGSRAHTHDLKHGHQKASRAHTRAAEFHREAEEKWKSGPADEARATGAEAHEASREANDMTDRIGLE